MNVNKKIIVCADDFALNPGISSAIIELLSKRRISATSCMTTSPLWPEWGAHLKPLAATVDIGLHLDLTQFTPLSASLTDGLKEPLSIGQTIIKAYSRQFSLSALQHECLLQLQSFRDVMGFAPNFIDGHQHIHQFPQIRDALLNVCQTYFGQHKPPMRLINGHPFLSPLRDSPLKLLIHALGRNAFKRQLDKADWPYYADFKGIYVFKGAPDVAALFKQFIHQIAARGIIMCHPGQNSDPNTDPISQLREQEYAFLNSSQWQSLGQAESIQLCRYSEMIS